MKRLILGLLLTLTATMGFAQAVTPVTVPGPTIKLAYTAPATFTNGAAITGTITYNLYQGASGAALAKIQSGIAGTTAVVTANVVPGTTYCFAITAVVATVESAQSTQACAVVAVPTPGAPLTLTIIVTPS